MDFSRNLMAQRPETEQKLEIIERPGVRKIGILSDTHVPERAPGLRDGVREAFSGVDLILHAGDISTPPVLHELELMAETFAVRGNNRRDRILFDPPLREKLLIRARGGFSIGLYHGYETLYQVITDLTVRQLGYKDVYARRLRETIRKLFSDVHCIVYGHIHWPFIEREGGILFINPGQSFGERHSSCAVLELGETVVRVILHPLGEIGRRKPLLRESRSFPRVTV